MATLGTTRTTADTSTTHVNDHNTLHGWYNSGGRGALGYAPATVNQTPITTAVDLTNLTVTVTVESGHRIKITGQGLARSSVAGDVFQLSIMEGPTLLNADKKAMLTADDVGLHVEWIGTPTAGVHTYKLQGLRSTGTGNLTLTAGAAFPAFILVEDIGV